jgi:hypothetical protein
MDFKKHDLDCDCDNCQWAYDRARDEEVIDEFLGNK